jgi:TonB family protein
MFRGRGWTCASRMAVTLSLVALTTCAGPRRPAATIADSTGTVAGHLADAFVHGPPPFYGSVVYLIPVAPSTEDWWVRLARPRYALVDPQSDRSLGYVDRTTCDEVGRFQFDKARPGDYYVYARVLWAYPIGDSTGFGGSAWVANVTVVPRDTAHVTLRTPNVFFQTNPPVRRFLVRNHPTDPDLPRFGEYVYVEELPEAVSKVPAQYPATARRMAVDGTVMVQALVGKDGLVKDTRIVKSIPLLDQAAEDAVRKWVFKPALTNNKPVAVWVAVPVKFTL